MTKYIQMKYLKFQIKKKIYYRKINLSNILKNRKVNIQQNLIINNNNNFNNSQLNSLINSSKNIKTNLNNINNDLNNQNINTDVNNNKNNFCCECKCHLNISNHINSLKSNKTQEKISIDHVNYFEFKSLYENLNTISNNKYYNNKDLQQKIKNIITENSLLKSSITSRTNSMLQKNATIKSIKSNHRKHFVSTIKPLKNFKHTCSIFNSTSINPNIDIKKKKIKKRNSVILTKRSETFSDIPDCNMIRLPTIDQGKEKKNLFQTNINGNENGNMAFGGLELKFQKTLKNKNDNNISSENRQKTENSKKKVSDKNDYNNLNVQNFMYGGVDKKSTMIINPDFFNKKKKGNLLSQINLNIQKTNQNLNNPDEFYSSYFKALLGNDQKLEAKKGKRRGSAICCSNSMIMTPVKNIKSMRTRKKKENKNN